MHPEERQRVTEDSGRVGPLRGKYEEEDDNDESWHDAKEDGWETVSYGQGQYGAAVEEEARVEEEEVGNRHVRGPTRSAFHFGWGAIQTWIIRSKQDHGANRSEEEPETSQRRKGPDENQERRVPNGEAV